MVREFEHDSLSDLKVLLDNDPEKDFFENIKHIQVRNLCKPFVTGATGWACKEIDENTRDPEMNFLMFPCMWDLQYFLFLFSKGTLNVERSSFLYFSTAPSPHSCTSPPAVTLSAALPQNHNPQNLLVAIGNALCFWSHCCEGAQPCDRGCHHYWNNISKSTLVQILLFVETLFETSSCRKEFPESYCSVRGLFDSRVIIICQLPRFVLSQVAVC